MKATGDLRKIDELGRLVIPKEVRTDMDLEIKYPIEIFVDQDMIIIQKYYPACTFCGDKNKDESKTIQFSGKIVCRSCVQSVTDMND